MPMGSSAGATRVRQRRQGRAGGALQHGDHERRDDHDRAGGPRSEPRQHQPDDHERQHGPRRHHGFPHGREAERQQHAREQAAGQRGRDPVDPRGRTRAPRPVTTPSSPASMNAPTAVPKEAGCAATSSAAPGVDQAKHAGIRSLQRDGDRQRTVRDAERREPGGRLRGCRTGGREAREQHRDRAEEPGQGADDAGEDGLDRWAPRSDRPPCSPGGQRQRGGSAITRGRVVVGHPERHGAGPDPVRGRAPAAEAASTSSTSQPSSTPPALREP